MLAVGPPWHRIPVQWAGRRYKHPLTKPQSELLLSSRDLVLTRGHLPFLVDMVPFICRFLEVSTKEQGFVHDNWTEICPLCLSKLPQFNSQADERESFTE